jgi:predicted phage tail protein
MSTAPSLTTVYLVGSLGKRFGEKWTLDVTSVAEAIRAIDINTRGAFTAYLRGPAAKRAYKVAIQKRTNTIAAEDIPHRSGRSTIYIMPTIRGRNSGTGKIIAGVVLTALAVVSQQYYLLPYTWGLVGTAGWAAAGTIVTGFGISLITGGIAQMLAPKPRTPGAPNEQEQAQTTSFSGNDTAIAQGGCIPVVYGRMLVSALPISITVENNDVSITDAAAGGSVVTTYLPGGGVQYGNENGE